MEWSKLKNIIILILLLSNLFLLVMAGSQERKSAQYQEQALLNAADVLELNGIRMDRDNLPEELKLAPMTVEREQESESTLAAALLGECTSSALGSGRYAYEGTLGWAEFRSNGHFSFTFPDGVQYAGERVESHALDTLEKIGFTGALVSQEDGGGKHTLVLRQTWQGLPVFSCEVTLEYENGCLRSIYGQRLMGTPQSSPGRNELISVPTALLRFLNGVTGLGDVCSEVVSMTPAYLLDASGDGTRLIPVWYVTTDTGAYSLDALTGTLERA